MPALARVRPRRVASPAGLPRPVRMPVAFARLAVAALPAGRVAIVPVMAAARALVRPHGGGEERHVADPGCLGRLASAGSRPAVVHTLLAAVRRVRPIPASM